jgi:adenosyl cobinamide kinase/adenosyl cobinamide phosphate guanylyltransferase
MKLPFKQETVTKRFSKLPESVQDLVLSDSLSSSLHNIIHSQEIKQEKQREFNEQITLAMVGLSSKNDLKIYITNDLGLDENKTANVFNKINSEILSPIKDMLLKELNKMKNKHANNTDPYKEPTKQ